MKRTPLRQRRTALKRKTAMRANLPNIAWLVARDKALERAHYWPECAQLGLEGECWGGIEVHHVLRRSQGGTDELSNLLCLCSRHHRYVHEHPAESYERGWLKRSAA